MSDIIHSTEIDRDGPWLITQERLLALDKLIELELEKIGEFGKKQSLVIHLDGDRRVAARSFEEALRDPALLNERAIGFTLKLEICDIECKLRVPCYETSLQLEVSPDRSEIAKGLFVELRRWVDTVKPPRWQVYWGRASPVGQWFVLLVAAIGIFSYLALLAPDTSALARSTRLSQASEILKAGVSASSRTVPFPSWAAWFLIIGAIFCIALSFAPSVVLGIGKGEEAIHRWRRWMNFVGISFPVWILGTFLWPKVLGFLQRLG